MRRSMGKSKSSKVFKKHSGTKTVNSRPSGNMRGGIRF